jgi:hypothetical protein
MIDTSQIREHMDVVGNDGGHVGTVDHLDGENQIKLTKNDPAAGGEHHYVSLDDVESVENGALRLKVSAQDAKRVWTTP